jgi:starch-binding outer membrane protein, SusD/RagB family
MKKILILAIGSLFMFGSCSQDFLDEYPPHLITAGNFYQNENQIIMAANSVYNQLYTVWGPLSLPYVYGDAYGGDSYIYLTVGTSGDWFDLANDMNVFSASGPIESAWNSYYNGIFRVNDFLEELERASHVVTTPGLKERLQAEALFVRASFYYYLAQCFSGVPLVTSVLTPTQAIVLAQNTEAEIVAKVEEDLRFAVNNLPATYPARDRGRVTSHAARAMLARVYMSYGKNNEARELLAQVINSGRFSLDSNQDGVVGPEDYAHVFDAYTKNSPECVLELQFIHGITGRWHNYVENYTPTVPFFTFPGQTQPVGTWGLGAVEERLFDAFEPNDNTRRSISAVMFITNPSNGSPFFAPHTAKFYHGFRDLFNNGSNVPIIRYSEILLNYAELTNDAQYLNMVRARAGLPGYGQPGYPSHINTLAEAIEHERRVEFSFEFQRGFDLKRTGRFLEVKGKELGRTLEPWRIHLPIPQNVIDVNTNMRQNQGY